MRKSILPNIIDGEPSILLLLSVLATAVTPTHALAPKPRDSSTCPSSYKQCSSSSLPNTFCCPSSASCISLDDDSSAICCPEGQNCAYIRPISCDINLQNPTLYPTNPLKTSRLNDKLPKCGSSCCPFGYKCNGGTCILDKDSSSDTTTSSSTSTSTSTPSSTTTSTSTAIRMNTTATNESCPSFPSKAVVAGFFPGAIFGAALTFLAIYLLRRRNINMPPSHKSANYAHRSSSGTVMGISSPIPADESSYRTDFLLRSSNSDTGSNPHRARFVLHRTGSKVKSLFSYTPRLNQSPRSGNESENDADTVPPLPTTQTQPLQPPAPITPPRQIIPSRQPSTESIRVYSPAGVCAGTGKLKPLPLPRTGTSTPDTTFSALMDRAGFQDPKGKPSYKVTPPKLKANANPMTGQKW